MSNLNLGDVTVDLDRRTASGDGAPRSLTLLEARLLRRLAEAGGDAVPKATLLAEVWGYRPGVQTRTVDVTVARLRAKLEVDPAQPRHLLTVHGVGYRLAAARLAEAAPGLLGRGTALASLRPTLSKTGAHVLLTGPPGVGKTSLARALAPDATWCDLRMARTAEQLEAHVRSALGLPTEADIGHALTGRRVVLDDCDRLEPDALALVERYAHTSATLVLTSRRRFALPRTTVFEVPPLAIEAAVALFERARPIEPAERDDVLRVLAALDGLPLAVELAAGLRLLRPRQIAERLSRRLDLLRAAGDASGSLREAMDLSWEALPTAAREALASLGVFAGVFSLEAAEAVLGPRGPDLLEELADHSLLVVRERGEQRFSLLETVRVYALERLHHEPARRVAAERAHAEHFAAHADALDRRAARHWRADCRADLAAARARMGADVELCARLTLARAPVLHVHGPAAELASELDELLSQPLQPASRAALLVERGTLERRAGRLEQASRDAAEAHTLAMDPLGRARALDLLGRVERQRGDLPGALTAHTQAASAYAEARDPREGDAFRRAAVVAALAGRPDEGATLLARARVCHERHGDDAGLATDLETLALATHPLTADLSAIDRMTEALVLRRADGDANGLQRTLANLGAMWLGLGRYEDARACFVEAIDTARAAGLRRVEAMTNANLAYTEIAAGRLADARAALSRARAVYTDPDARRLHGYVHTALGIVCLLEGDARLAVAELESACEDAGHAGARHEAAFATGALTAACVQVGDREGAQRALDRTEALGRGVEEHELLVRARAAMDAADGRFEAAEQAAQSTIRTATGRVSQAVLAKLVATLTAR